MLKSIDKDWFFVYNKKVVKATYLGVAQLVACLNGVQEAASSNLATQTKRNPLPSWDSGFLLFLNIFALYIVRIFLLFNSPPQNTKKAGASPGNSAP